MEIEFFGAAAASAIPVRVAHLARSGGHRRWMPAHRAAHHANKRCDAAAPSQEFHSQPPPEFPMRILSLALLSLALPAWAQLTTDFPANSEAVTAESFEQNFAGRTLEGTRADGTTFRIDPAKGGSYSEMSRGRSANGKWRIEAGKLCTEMYRTDSGCNDVRAAGDVLYYKRNTNGEVVALKLQ
jgi:hypothetical protein